MKKIIFAFFIITILILFAGVGFFFYIISPTGNKKDTVYLEVKQGDSARSIGKILQNEGVIRNARIFSFLSQKLKYDRKLLSGYYRINRGMNMIEIMKYINEGKQVLSRFTIAEGKNIYDIAYQLEKEGLVKKEDFLKACHDKRILDYYKIPSNSVEGYLFPSTYYIVKGNSAEKFVVMMIDTLFKNFPKEKLEERSKELKINTHQLLTMASIVEKEMGPLDDPAMISSVYYNRLKINMRLQADPTTIYAMVLEKGVPIEKPNLITSDLLMTHPYNTYMNTGLPPGPISSSGAKAINAALYPASTDYLFFVADGTGKHAFTKYYEEHLKNIDKYILKK